MPRPKFNLEAYAKDVEINGVSTIEEHAERLGYTPQGMQKALIRHDLPYIKVRIRTKSDKPQKKIALIIPLEFYKKVLIQALGPTETVREFIFLAIKKELILRNKDLEIDQPEYFNL